ncbi:MAG: hypothetical protein ACRC47_09930 [Shewanella sp.]
MKFLSLCECGKNYPGDMSHCPHCGAPEWASSQAMVNPRDYAYDLETYPNCFTARFIHIATDTRWRFEISEFVDDSAALVAFVMQLNACDARGVGYNNVGFDYPVLHRIVMMQLNDPRAIYDHAMTLIKGSKDEKFALQIWDRDRLFEQLDLIMLWHYNKENPATGTEPTSLKALEIAMRMDNVEDLPFPVGTVLNREQIEVLHTYNEHDVIATIFFYVRSLTQIKLREELSVTFGKNFLNHSNTKLGGDILIHECEKAGIEFYDYVGRQKHKRQTIRASINLAECIFHYVKFERPEFERIRAYLASKTITETKGVFTNLNAEVNGLKYYFGTGGIHASVESRIFESNSTHQIIDVDVASFYPNLAIKNKIFAKHLGEQVCVAYSGLYDFRQTFPKGSSLNAAIKEALNAFYGNSNNAHSVFLDAKVTMTITLNGQLLLCMLVEQLIKVPGLEMIQANTDGVTYYCPREYIEHTRALCKWWEQLTQLTLEEAQYSRMFIRDVNSYIAEYESGKLKRIGAYAHERMDENPGTREIPYGKDPSQLVVAKAAEAALVRGEDIRTFIMNHADDYDFMCRAKVPRSNRLVMRWPEYDAEVEMASIIRYYVSNHGGTLVKIAPPTGEIGTWKRATKVSDKLYNQVIAELSTQEHTDKMMLDAHYGTGTELDSAGIPWDERIHTKNRSKHDKREMGICVGWRVTDCSNVKNFDRSTLNYDYYVEQAEKLVKPLLTVMSK